VIRIDIQAGGRGRLSPDLRNLSSCYFALNKLADTSRVSRFLKLLVDSTDDEKIFLLKFDNYAEAVEFGDSDQADRLWSEIERMGRDWSRSWYRPGDAESWHAFDLFFCGKLTLRYLEQAEDLVRSGHNRPRLGPILRLRGLYHLGWGEPAKAVESLVASAHISRETGSYVSNAEAVLALARQRANHKFEVRSEAERLAKGNTDGEHNFYLAELWKELGEPQYAVEQPLRAHR
jgi:hypothetical protein